MKHFAKSSILIVFAIILLVSSSESFAGDKWKFTEIKSKGPLRLTGDDWLFKGKIKNIGETQSKGDRITITINIYGGSALIDTKNIHITPGVINSGENVEFEFSISGHESGFTYQKITLEIQSSETDGLSETFNIQSR